MTNINDFDPNLLNIDDLLFESDELIMYNIKYNKNLNSPDSLYLVLSNLHAYIEKSVEDRYLIFASTEKNKIMLENYTKLRDEIKKEIQLITDDKVTKYIKYFMKIRFITNDDLPLSKIINIAVCVVTVNSIFK